MAYTEITPGGNVPEIVNVIIDIPRGGGRNKYEFDKSTGRLTLDRVNATTLSYPADYGFIPGTLCEDGDPLDVLLIIDEPLLPGVVVPARPIGVLHMIDEGEGDEKVVCVPAKDISKDHLKDLADFSDQGEHFKKVIEHFYSHFKDWKNNWRGVSVEFKGWGNAAEAKKVIQESVSRASHS